MARKFEVVGVEKVSYERKKDGKQVEGVKYYACFEFDPAKDENCVGLGTKDFYFSSDYDPDLKLGDKFQVIYDERGYVDEIHLVNE